jgi:hypothetical protein
MLSKLRKLTALVFLALAASSAGADKVVTDPNLKPAKQGTSSSADARMTKKITYYSGFTRLHYVTEEIARQTGATIRCGKDVNDWPVRDLPLTVCANDIPADKLLQAVTDATHTLLTVSRVAGVNYYKVWKNSRREKLLQRGLDTQRKYNDDLTRWVWDGLVKLKDIPDSAFKTDLTRDGMQDWMAGIRELGGIIEHLDKSCLERGLAGETFCLRYKDLPPAARNALKVNIRKSWKRNKEHMRQFAQDNPNRGWFKEELTDEDLQRASVAFMQFGGQIKNLYVSTAFILNPSEEDRLTTGGSGGELQHYAHLFQNCTDPRIPPGPKYPDHLATSRFDKDIGSPNLKLLDADSDWDIPLLKTVVSPEKPKDKEDLVYADALTALAKASGCTIVCEDFLSFRRWQKVSTIIDCKTSIGEMLKAQTSNRWLVDEEARLIVGWDKWWCEGHWRMMPESILLNLQTKLDTTGADIDDAAPFANYGKEQLMLWLLESRGYEGGRQVWSFGCMDSESKLWQIYDSLSPADKALAKSDAGLPLGKLGTYALSSVFKTINDRRLNQPDFLAMEPSARQRKHGLPTDPDKIALLTMRVVRHRPELIWEAEGTNPYGRRVPTPTNFTKHSYNIKIEGENTDATYGGPIDQYFPAYSPKREAEIEKQRKEESAGKAKPEATKH